ncbi:hypothetical protein K7432_014713 [Basidiobolus ranarum]|uniref:Uncharacterized protein n=1 Tax=Basidiobolus ranarum TaxID=34480 RepID=A0ABR2VP25_9FUNG
MEPGTPVGGVPNLEAYPTPGTSQQAKTPANKTHGSPTSNGTFQSVEISPKDKGKQKATQTLQSTLLKKKISPKLRGKQEAERTPPSTLSCVTLQGCLKK